MRLKVRVPPDQLARVKKRALRSARAGRSAKPHLESPIGDAGHFGVKLFALWTRRCPRRTDQ